MTELSDASYRHCQCRGEARLIGEDPSQLLELSVKAFRFYYRDPIAGTLRRLLSMERYRNGQMDALYRELFLDAPIDNQSELISQLIRQGYMPKHLDPRTAAVEAFAPFLLLMNQYDCQPELEEQAVDELKAHIAQHLSRYLICADGSPL